MPLFTRKDVNILFIHIPKTAGTYVCENFEQRGFQMVEPIGRIVGHVTMQHMLARHAVERYRSYDISKVFSIVRNPVSRLVSECNYYPYGEEINSCVQNMFYLYRMHMPFYRDNHIRPQSDFINEQTIVFKYEEGVDVAINQLFSDIDGESINGTPVNASNRRYNIEQLNTKSLDMIHEFYKEDFDKFEY